MTTREKLVAEIEAFLKRHSVSATRFGELSVNDTKLVFELRDGSDITTARMDKIRAWMREYAEKAAAEKLARPKFRAVARSAA